MKKRGGEEKGGGGEKTIMIRKTKERIDDNGKGRGKKKIRGCGGE